MNLSSNDLTQKPILGPGAGLCLLILRPLSFDSNVGAGLARIWLRPRAIGLCREIWRLAAVGDDGFLSGRDRGVSFVTAERRINFGGERDCRGAVSARACSLARCLPADIARRAAARPHLLALEHALMASGSLSPCSSIASSNLFSARGYAAMLARAETVSYQRFSAACPSPIGRPAALVAKSTATTAVISATEKSSPATKATSASRASKSA
jgi:hypothetical protein